MDPGLADFISSDNAQSMVCAVGRIHNGLKIMFCFKHATPFYYHHHLDLLILHIYPGKAEFCSFYYCTVLLCVQIIEYIMAQWSYSFVCTLHYRIIIIMQTYLNILNL